MSIGSRIKEARKYRNLSQKALGQKLGISQQMVYQYENGTTPNDDMLAKMSLALNLDPMIVCGEYCFRDSTFDGSGTYQGKDKIQSEAFNSSQTTDALRDSKQISKIQTLTDSRNKLLSAFLMLNQEGQDEAIKRVVEMAYVPGYQRDITDPYYQTGSRIKNYKDSLSIGKKTLPIADPTEQSGDFMAAEFSIDDKDQAAPAPDPDHSDPEDK